MHRPICLTNRLMGLDSSLMLKPDSRSCCIYQTYMFSAIDYNRDIILVLFVELVRFVWSWFWASVMTSFRIIQL